MRISLAAQVDTKPAGKGKNLGVNGYNLGKTGDLRLRAAGEERSFDGMVAAHAVDSAAGRGRRGA